MIGPGPTAWFTCRCGFRVRARNEIAGSEGTQIGALAGPPRLPECGLCAVSSNPQALPAELPWGFRSAVCHCEPEEVPFLRPPDHLRLCSSSCLSAHFSIMFGHFLLSSQELFIDG